MHHEVDVAIIGAGSAGMRAYREVASVTDSVRVIEAGPYGTTCARVGCMPSKLLIAAADAAVAGHRADVFGVRYGAARIDGRAVMRRVRAERDRFVGFVEEAVAEWPPAHRIRATARFASDHDLELDGGDTVRADRIVIATGSRPDIPDAFDPFGDRVVTSDDVFEWEDLPESIAVFGTGVIGLELGQAFARLGVRTSVFGRSGSVGPLTDPDVLREARDLFAHALDFHAEARVVRHAREGDEIVVERETDDGRVTARYAHALVAAGRRPNIDGLALERTSLALDERGGPARDRMTGRCGESSIFIAGDAGADPALLHVATDEGEAAGYNAARFPEPHRFEPRAPISVMFTDPQIATVGRGHAELADSGIDFECGAVDWADQGRARAMAINEGLLRVYGERVTGRLLGAEMVGPKAEHLAHLLAWSLQSRLTVKRMLAMPFYHPVLEEGVRSALRALDHALDTGPVPPARCIDCGPGC